MPKPRSILDKTLHPYIRMLAPHMSSLKRGEVLKDSVIKESGKDQKQLDGAIRTWFRRERGIVIKHSKEVGGYRLLTNAEQARQPRKRLRQSKRFIARGIVEGSSVDVTKLQTDTQKKELELSLRLSGASLQVLTENERELRLTVKHSSKKQLSSAKIATD